MNAQIKAACLATGLVLNLSYSNFADWPEYRGPNQNGISSEKISWSSQGPRELWKAPMNAGFSSITVSDGKAYTLVLQKIEGVDREVCVAFDATSGKQLWTAPLSVAKYDGGGNDGTPDNKGGDGPRSTPAIVGDSVYVLDARLTLHCFNTADGKTKWSKDIAKEHNGKLITWQNAASPVVEGNLIFVAGGGEGEALLGIDRNTGKTVWKAEDDKITHATPITTEIHGVKQVIFFTQKGLVALTLDSGKVLWRHPYQFNVSTAASPVVAGDIVYCSAGYGVGAGAARIKKTGDAWEATEIWRVRGNQLANHWSTPVYKDGYLYGMFQFKEYGKGALKCVEMATGKEIWSEPNFGPGNVTLVSDKLLVLGDRGQLVLVDPSPTSYKELGRMETVEGKCWSTPTFSSGRIFVRSTKEGACFDAGAKLGLR
ncbi:MAG: PQQ-binding-like beta-propeller repeat protein [Verrucomicrobiota bacterium]|nr:PQQ-binding-like beta-propeller repeat protein [Verrucomicrobiota bacterium]